MSHVDRMLAKEKLTRRFCGTTISRKGLEPHEPAVSCDADACWSKFAEYQAELAKGLAARIQAQVELEHYRVDGDEDQRRQGLEARRRGVETITSGALS